MAVTEIHCMTGKIKRYIPWTICSNRYGSTCNRSIFLSYVFEGRTVPCVSTKEYTVLWSFHNPATPQCLENNEQKDTGINIFSFSASDQVPISLKSLCLKVGSCPNDDKFVQFLFWFFSV